MVEQEPSLERLDERQKHDRATLAAYKQQMDRMEKELNELKTSVQWIEWQRQEDRDQHKALAPLAQRVSALDSWVVKLVIGAALSAFLGMAFGNFAIFGGP